ncbi:MAG: flavodoxin family protein [Candidatus Bathyarchaeia archaeon]|jgi:flavorubredoxin
MKVIVFYDSKYGNTKLVAEKIAEGLKSEGAEADLVYVKETTLDGTINADAVVFGAPNHMGRPSRTMKTFIDRLAGVDLKTEKAAVFGTYAGRERQQDRAEKKLEKLVTERLPRLKQVVSGLSVRVNGVSGPVVESELPKCIEFGRAIAGQLNSLNS